MSLGLELVSAMSASSRPAPIVVGLDGSEASLAALRWAADEAAAHQAPLVAVHVLDPRSRAVASYAHVASAEPAESDEAALVERMVAASGVRQVRRVFEVGVPGQVLVRSAIGARMLVLGHADHHRHRDGETQQHGPVLGSIARACVARAACPVVVIPIPARRPSRGAAEPEPQQAGVALSASAIPAAPLVGGRTIYPRRQPVPVTRGTGTPTRKEVNR